MTTQERRYTASQHADLSIIKRGGNSGGQTLIGYAAVFYRDGDPATEYRLFEGAVERISRTAFDRALKDKHDARALFNHDPNFLLGRVSAGTVKLLTADQADSLIKAAENTEHGALIVLAIVTGLRQGELLALFWSDFDADKGTLQVQRSLIKPKSGFQFKPPKSEKGRRTVSLPAIAIEALADRRAKMLVKGWAAKDHLIFCDSATGGPIRKRDFYRHYYKPLLTAAGVPDVRFHDLRHTSATLMLADGVHPKIASEWLGHARVSMTLDVYSHVIEGMDREAAGTFDRLLKRNA